MLVRDVVASRVESAFENDVLPALAQFTRIACLSPGFDPDWALTGAIDAAAVLLSEYARRRPIPGLTVETVRLGSLTPVIIIEVEATDRERAGSTTLLYGHFDKQPPLGTWREGLSAFEPVREGDRLYGRGSADDGYALFSALLAIEALDAAERGHGRIVVLLEASEESGSPDLEPYLDKLAERIGAPSLVICLDSGCATYDRLWATTSLRGVVVGTLTVAVLSEGVHSGHAGGIVPSPFRIARQLLSRVEDESTGEILLAELRSEIPAHRHREIGDAAREIGDAAAGVFPALDGVTLGGASTAERIERGTWRAALAITGQEGLPNVRDGGNVLLPSTALKLSMRIPPNCDAEKAALALERALIESPPDGAHVTFEREQPVQGWDCPAPAKWLAEAIQQASLDRFGAPPASLGLGGSIPFLAALGRRFPKTEFLATGVLGPESNAHGPNEFLHIPTAKAVTCAVADVLAAAP